MFSCDRLSLTGRNFDRFRDKLHDVFLVNFYNTINERIAVLAYLIDDWGGLPLCFRFKNWLAITPQSFFLFSPLTGGFLEL